MRAGQVQPGFNSSLAWEAVAKYAFVVGGSLDGKGRKGLALYEQYGYIPLGHSVSKPRSGGGLRQQLLAAAAAAAAAVAAAAVAAAAADCCCCEAASTFCCWWCWCW